MSLVLTVKLDELLRAKQKANNPSEIELELEALLDEPILLQRTNGFEVNHIASRYRVSLGAMIGDSLEKIYRHVQSVGSDTLMLRLDDFPYEEGTVEKSVHLNFLGITSALEGYEFRDLMYDQDESVVIKTRPFNNYNETLGPFDDALGLTELFEKGVHGYFISATVTDRLDGNAEAVLVLDSKNRKIAEEVHAEVFSALRNSYRAHDMTPHLPLETLKKVHRTSPHAALLRIHDYQTTHVY